MGQRRTVVLQGRALRFWECGSGEQLLFLHGAALPAASFSESVALLSRRYHVIVPELPGFGTSDLPGPGWGFEQYAAELHELLLRRGYRIRRLVGYSFGGGIALHLAPRLDGLQRLTLLSPAGAGVGYGYGGMVARTIAEGWSGFRDASRAQRRGAFARIVAAFLWNGARHPFMQHRILRVTLRCMRSGYRHAALQVPATVVTVDRDIFFPPALQERLYRSVPRGEGRRLRGTHLWVLLHPHMAARVVFDDENDGGLPGAEAVQPNRRREGAPPRASRGRRRS
jgi:pimeloyl-ACP methyl ester carboxylesterase